MDENLMAFVNILGVVTFSSIVLYHFITATPKDAELWLRYQQSFLIFLKVRFCKELTITFSEFALYTTSRSTPIIHDRKLDTPWFFLHLAQNSAVIETWQSEIILYHITNHPVNAIMIEKASTFSWKTFDIFFLNADARTLVDDRGIYADLQNIKQR